MSEKMDTYEWLGMWNIKETWWEAVSEEDLGRVSEDLKKAWQARQQIQAQHIKDKNSAIMLQILLQINDDRLLSRVVALIDDHLEINEIFMFFVPFFQDNIIVSWLKEQFKAGFIDIYSLTDLTTFVKNTMQKLEKTQNIPQIDFISFIKDIIYYFDIGNIKTLAQKSDRFEEYDERLQKSLFEEIY